MSIEHPSALPRPTARGGRGPEGVTVIDLDESLRNLRNRVTLTGRDSEMALLTGLMTEVARGRGSAVLIEGEPGIGKSALVRVTVAEAPDDRCQVFWGAGDELGQALPLLPLLDGLRVRYGADFVPPDGDRLAVLTASGLVEQDSSRLRLTRRGRLLSNEVFERLLPEGGQLM